MPWANLFANFFGDKTSHIFSCSDLVHGSCFRLFAPGLPGKKLNRYLDADAHCSFLQVSFSTRRFYTWCGLVVLEAVRLQAKPFGTAFLHKMPSLSMIEGWMNMIDEGCSFFGACWVYSISFLNVFWFINDDWIGLMGLEKNTSDCNSLARHKKDARQPWLTRIGW